MSSLEQFHIVDSTPRGAALLEGSEQLQHAMQTLVNSPRPEVARIGGMQLLDAGRYSFTFSFEGLALKVSSLTSSQEAHDSRKPVKPEDLRRQFMVMTALRGYLDTIQDNITAPEQFFVSHTPHDAFILAQEFMEGWEPIGDRNARELEGKDIYDAAVQQEAKEKRQAIRRRLQHGLADFAMLEALNDLRLKETGLHGGNLLVPRSAAFNAAIPLCIIDQPGARTKA